MRRRGIPSCILLLLAAAPAFAQPADISATATADAAPSAPQLLGYGALPGGLHAPSADTLPAGTMAFGAVGGFGYRSDLLGPDHRFGRGIGDLAFAYAPIGELTIALALDGRYDKHYGLAPSGDDGYVGDPRLLVRYGKAIGANRVGVQLGLWVPGKDAPSVAASAISFEGRLVGAFAAGPGRLSLSAGFRLDNSAKSVDERTTLSAQDQVSLGVSDYHAAVGGLHYGISSGKALFGVEASIDRYIGDGAPGQILRAGVHGGINLTAQWSLIAFVEGAKVPGMLQSDVMANRITLIPYEPIVTGGLGLHGRFGGGGAAADGAIKRNVKPEIVEVIEYADLEGQVTDEAGKPVVGAKVTVKLKNNTGTAVSDGQGNYTVKRLPIGKTVDGQTTLDDTGAEVTIEVEGKKAATQTLTLAKGANKVANVSLEPALPPGQLRAVVRAAATGKPIANAVITIEPGGQTATSAADGTLAIDLQPGRYKATATVQGFKAQTLDVTIDPNGVALKNFELAK